MSENLDKVLGLLNKKYGKGCVGYASKYMGLELKRISSGSFTLDFELGGGLPIARIIEIYGELSSGKTMLAMKAIAEVQKAGKNVVYIDAEGVFSPEWAETLGVDIEKLIISRAETAEEMLSVAEACVRSGDCGLLVIDSVAALSPMHEEEVGMDESETLGDRARMMNRFIRRIHAALNVREDEVPNECMVILINQVRDAIGAYGNPMRTTGGKGIGFGASVRLLVRRKDWIMEGTGDKAKPVGQTVSFQVTKSKVSVPYRSGSFDFYFAENSKSIKVGDIDLMNEIITYGIYYDIIKQSGKFYTIDSGVTFLEGRDKIVAHYKDNPEEVEKLKKLVLDVALRGV